MPTRREFIKTTIIAGTAVALFRCAEGRVWAYSQSPKLRKFVAPLPGLGDIPVANAATNAAYPGADFYTLSAQQFTQRMHPDLPGPTHLWGYVDQTTNKSVYLGPIIVAQRGKAAVIRMTYNLPPTHILPVDTSIMGAEPGVPVNRMCVHLHGGLVPWTSDGGPFAWFSPTGVVDATDGSAGPNFLNGVPGYPGVADYYYPNNQSERLAWYHDHAMGITRLNAYSGLAAGYLITDSVVGAMAVGNTPLVPGLAYTIPLVLQDKSFKQTADKWGQAGDLFYPYQYEHEGASARWDLGEPSDGFTPATGPLPSPSSVPEAFFDTPVINGMAYPYADVEPRRYRFLALNGSQARFFHLQLYYESALNPGEPDFSRPGPGFIQIGSEGGILPSPVVLNNPPVQIPTNCDGSVNPGGPFNLLLAPAERADLIIDFSKVPVGSNLILYNDAPAPFPMGDSRNDYYTGCPDQTAQGGAAPTQAGYGPNTRTLMQFRVAALNGNADPLDFDATLESLMSQLPSAYQASHQAFGEPDLDSADPNALREVKTLNEDFDEFGRLIQRVGTDTAIYADSYGRNYMDQLTEVYDANQMVIWDIYNTTGDTHPMHFHLVNVQVVGRATFDASIPNIVEFVPTSAWMPPDPNYRGWKETVRMNPGEVTRVMMKMTLPKVPFTVPGSPRQGMQNGHEYVWHCHILEHEEHDMMRPLVILP
ncbi:MAG TPA: multicopper oxidase domain-containing protein [Gemmataceae bacterium]|nr:multicopper oxidase domain-containing protein [Gemmataceae bacterium]